MKKVTYLALVFIIFAIGCQNDDDVTTVPVRDRGEVFTENIAALEAYLSTHTYNYDDYDPADPSDFEIVIDSITAANADRTPLIDRPELERLSVSRNDVDYEYFVLNVRQGEGTPEPTFADSTLVSYRGFTLNGNSFDSAINPVWLDLTSSIEGFALSLSRFNPASNAVQNPDGTLTFENSGVGAMFIPSGLAYFNNPPVVTIAPYTPLIFTFQLRSVEDTDHDGDGILSIFEDVNNDGTLRSPDGDDTDGDRRFNYIDADDDGDGIPTRDENPDPNGDGNPDDALDSDNDGIPDYLDNQTNS